MATWYSIKNRLEAGEVKATNTFERFLTVFITSYGCIDMWYRDVTTSSEDDEREVRIYYLQKDTTFTAANSWERNNERPEFWLQFKGNEETIRASMISLLPYISQLHDRKRHGEWNFGATQPFEGQGSIVTPSGSGFVISGRFGDIAVTSNGTPIDWETIVWAFDGCNPTATVPNGDDICFKTLGAPTADCGGGALDPVGTCLTGSCGNWSATYPITDADCSGTWFEKQDLSNYTQEEWNENQSCPDPVGTCVTGDCDNGFSAVYPVTQANCNGVDWFPDVDLSGNNSAYWENYYNCPDPIGCCVIGTTCDYVSVSETTESQCATNAGSNPFTWTENVKGAECTREYLEETNNCSTVPQTITIAITYAYSSGQLGFKGACSPFNADSIVPFQSPGTMSAVTPGSAGLPGTPLIGPQPGDCNGYTLTGYDNEANQAYGTVTFNLVYTYLYSIGDSQYYGIDSSQGWPAISVNKILVNFLADNYLPSCSSFPDDDEGFNFYFHKSTSTTTEPGTINGTIVRNYEKGLGVVLYSGGCSFHQASSGNVVRNFSFQNTTAWSVPQLFAGQGWFKALYGDSPPSGSNPGEPDLACTDPWNKAEMFGNISINQFNLSSTWGSSLVDQDYADPDGINLYIVDSNQLNATITEAGSATETPG